MNVNSLEKLSEWLATDTYSFRDQFQGMVALALKERNWSTADLADAAFLSQRQVQRILKHGITRKTTLRTFLRILHALDYDLPIEKLYL